MTHRLALTTWLAAAVLVFPLLLSAQSGQPALEAAAAAVDRLDFATALSRLGAEIEAAPAAPEPRLARAALHRRMNRPALALDDLDAVLAADPANGSALRARGDLLLALGATSRAIVDFDALLEADPNDALALIARARARAGAGLRALAQADLDAAGAIAPDSPALAAARDTLRQPAPVAATFDPAAMMDPAFRVVEGDEDAPHAVVIVHAGNDLAREAGMHDPAPLAAAIDAGLARVTHLFTYTGDDSAIWANLALICAGSEGFATVYAALATPEARAAMDDIDAGRGRDAFEARITAAYDAAGLRPDQATDCAFNRAKALAYLADWTARRDSIAPQGSALYDTWPLYVLDGVPVLPSTLHEALVAPGHGDDRPEIKAGSQARTGPDPVARENAAAAEDAARAGFDDTAPRELAAPARAPVLRPRVATLAPAERPDPIALLPDGPELAPLPVARAPAQTAAAPLAGPVLPEGIGPPDTEARIPAQLRGIWAPSLVDCIAYTDAIASPATLDAALPGLNPLDGPPIGTVLLTSRQMHLFNALGTGCGLIAVNETEDEAAPWTAELVCTTAIAPETVVPLTLTRTDGAGPAPRFSARFGAQTGVELIQCRPLGALGRDFAPLWQTDLPGCALRAPVAGGQFTFTADAGGLTLGVTPDAPPDGMDESRLEIALDGVPLASGGAPENGAWRISLAEGAAAAERLALGLLLEVRAVDPSGTPVWSRVMPLLGSTRALATLEGCAPARP